MFVCSINKVMMVVNASSIMAYSNVVKTSVYNLNTVPLDWTLKVSIWDLSHGSLNISYLTGRSHERN